ncbi:MAG TPA: SDR family oxidoreductase [Thermoflexales bacterium]|mgnify:FL=1|nr:SDR family oxidoreductase [Thermoflexales bacterium]
MKTIVITGSTRGIGRGLAQEFLKRGHNVVVSGRGQASTTKTAGELSAQFGAENVLSQPCDVSDLAQVQALWDAAVAGFGRVDIWINNAGIGSPRKNFYELDMRDVNALVNTNLLGLFHGCRVAMAGMLKQGGGQIYNMEGYGSNGMVTQGLSVYGATKRAVTYLTKSFAKEAEGTPVQVCWLNPGVVITDLLVDDYAGDPQGWESAKKAFNILGDKVEDVTPALTEKILRNTKNGARVAWLSNAQIGLRFATARFKKRDVLGDVKPKGV